MKIVVYGPERRVGAWENDQIIDLAHAYERYTRGRASSDEGLPSQLLAFIEAGRPGIDKARQAIEHATNGDAGDGIVFARNQVELHAPWPGRRIACVGGNYAEHLHGMYMNRPGQESRTLEQTFQEARDAGQWGFWKVPDEVVGPGGQMPYPKRTEFLDYEGEAAIVFGARGKDIPASGYRNYVWGVTLVQDGSIRDGMGNQPRAMSYNLAKNFDGGVGVGPCIVVNELDPEDVVVETRVNGQLRQRFNTSDMIFSWGEIIEYLSQDFTFVPGDILSGGTGAGTAADKTPRGPDGSRSQELFLHQGDTVDVSSPSIGLLRIAVV